MEVFYFNFFPNVDVLNICFIITKKNWIRTYRNDILYKVRVILQSLDMYIVSRKWKKKKKTSRHFFTIREMVSSEPLTLTIMLFFPPLLKIIEIFLSAILRHFSIFKQRLIHRIHVLKTYCGQDWESDP